MKAGSSAVQVMQQKRSYHGNIITKNQQQKAVVEEDSKVSERGVADGRSQDQSTDNDLKVSSNSTNNCVFVVLTASHVYRQVSAPNLVVW